MFSEAERVTLSKIFCDRAGILGADGILFFQNSDNVDGKMRMFNPDGSEAEMCGNGLRCIGRFACEQLGQNLVFIETLKGVSRVVNEKNIHPGVATYKAELNTISLNTKDIPINVHFESLIKQPLSTLSNKLTFTAVSMPNPHIVAMVDNISDDELGQIGKKANEIKELFPNGVNVNFCQVIGEAAIYVRTYERGVGLTNSCGSGMSSASLVACLLEQCSYDKPIDVYNRGGLVQCEVKKNNSHHYSVFLSGNATFIFKNTITYESPNFSNVIQYFEHIFLEEIQNYGRLIEYSEQKLKQL
ncbi:diaminopimelate epimerase [Beggiatoa sp. PS]|nr:diaminopimelate epimerase [Beggiatoa sp. PS]